MNKKGTSLDAHTSTNQAKNTLCYSQEFAPTDRWTTTKVRKFFF